MTLFKAQQSTTHPGCTERRERSIQRSEVERHYILKSKSKLREYSSIDSAQVVKEIEYSRENANSHWSNSRPCGERNLRRKTFHQLLPRGTYVLYIYTVLIINEKNNNSTNIIFYMKKDF